MHPKFHTEFSINSTVQGFIQDFVKGRGANAVIIELRGGDEDYGGIFNILHREGSLQYTVTTQIKEIWGHVSPGKF